DHSLSFSDLDLLVATRGPGSFTSLRIGFATLKGISLSRDIPLVSVPTLRLIAEACPVFEGITVSVMDAKKKRYYLGAYSDGRTLCELDGNADDLLPYIKGYRPVTLTGIDANAFSMKLASVLDREVNLNVDPQCYRPLGGVLIQMGIDQYQQVGADDIGQGPVYIRRSDAEEALLKKLSEE
ncbi:MAG: tRNA (adenosine(37)-N6)-threonylcarbamoyltransferase complex dimerization subunit type 1 TsaB, partial [Bullifex sp.]